MDASVHAASHPGKYLYYYLGYANYELALVSHDKGRALKQFGKAITLFNNYRAPNPLAPMWGKAQAYAWKAKAEANAGNKMRARLDYQAALRLTPDYQRARAGLASLGGTKASVPEPGTKPAAAHQEP